MEQNAIKARVNELFDNNSLKHSLITKSTMTLKTIGSDGKSKKVIRTFVELVFGPKIKK